MQLLKKKVTNGLMVLGLMFGLMTSAMAEEHYRTTVTKALAKNGDSVGQFNLGLMHYYGDPDVPQDYRKALELFSKSAIQGLDQAQLYLGLMYENGEGGLKSTAKAKEWYLKAANQGLGEAQYNLGLIYENGKGVRQDYAKAREWYLKAANQDYFDAQYNLGLMYENGKGGLKSTAKAKEWFRKSCNNGQQKGCEQITTATAATDWTPYLKSMMSGCNFPNPNDKLPSRYKASIISKDIKGNTEIEGEDIYTTYTLNTATAFGQPLAKVEYLSGWEWGHLKLYFKDTNFTTLRPQFKLPKLDSDPYLVSKVMKNNAQGYEVDDGIGVLKLEFNKTQKSISCFWGH